MAGNLYEPTNEDRDTCEHRVALKNWVKEQYYRYRDFFPADLWAMLIMLAILIIGLIFVL